MMAGNRSMWSGIGEPWLLFFLVLPGLLLPSCRPKEREDSRQPASNPAATAQSLPADGYDFGLLDKAATRTVLLSVPNPATGRLHVQQVRSDCRCLKGSVVKNDLGPGEPILLNITFQAPRDSQRYTGRLLIATDDKTRPVIPVRVKADVGLPLLVKDDPLLLPPPHGLQEIRTQVQVLNRGDKPVRLLYGTSTPPGCTAAVPSQPLAPGASLSLPLTIDPHAVGRRGFQVLIATDLPTQTQLAIDVRFPPPASMAAGGPRPTTRPGLAADQESPAALQHRQK